MSQPFTFYVKRRGRAPRHEGRQHQATTAGSSLLRGFAKHVAAPSSGGDFPSRALQACMEDDAEEALGLYLMMEGADASARYWDLRLFRTYYAERHRFVDRDSKPLLNASLLAYVLERAERSLANAPDAPTVLASIQIMRGD
jgi:hypothetical protein